MAAYVWPWAPATDTVRRSLDELPAITEASTALSKDLKRGLYRMVPNGIHERSESAMKRG